MRTDVGDRYVLSELNQNGGILGGEPSGHIICRDRTTTGDGIVAALQVLEAMQVSGSSLHDLRRRMQRLPQILVNVPLGNADAQSVVSDQRVEQAIADAEVRLAGSGRVLLRPSGTEPLIRVMVEGKDAPLVTELAHEIALVIAKQVDAYSA